MLGDGTPRGTVCASVEGGAARVVIAAGSGGRFHAWGALAAAPAHAMALDLLLLRPPRLKI
jgi:hypothetical protein